MREKRIVIDGIETNYIAREDGTIYNEKTGKDLKGTITVEGYCRVQVSLPSENGKRKSKTLLVQRVIAEAFVDNPDYESYIKHKDGNLQNNAADNLYWSSTPSISGPKTMPARMGLPLEEVLSSPDEWKPWPQDKRYYASINGEIYSTLSKKILKQESREGYERVLIGGKKYSVHRIIYETFVGPIDGNVVIDHINGIRNDNRLDNLRCISQSDNMYHAQEMGHKCQKKILQYDKDGNFIKEWPSAAAAAREYGVSACAIGSAAKRDGTSCGYKWKLIE